MALVCESTPTPSSEPTLPPEETKPESSQNDDLEDGEIEDDGDDEILVEPPKPEIKETDEKKDKAERSNERKHDRTERRRHEDKKRHMTEAEKSILHLRKRERLQREKWEKYRKEQVVTDPPVDDFAINIEKAIASVLKKDKQHSDEEKDEEKRGRKRKNRDKEKQRNKQRRTDSPKSEDNDNESKSPKNEEKKERSLSPPRSDDSYDSEYSSDRSRSDERRERKREYKKKGRNRDRKRKKSRERERRNEQQFNSKDAQGVCVFFLQGKCQKNDCPYSHEAVPPMKLELCKFYLKDCCAKGEKCSYMHSEFPCKFYHTGLVCLQGDNCKFAHGRPLDEHRKQILFKHIETAPREILGGFPRMSREEALNKINVAQQNLMIQYGTEKKIDKGVMPNIFDINVPVPIEINTDAPKPKNEKSSRNRPSRWQDPDPIQPFISYADQDMRINSNGDIDMRTLPPLTQIAPPPTTHIEESPDVEQNFTQDIDIRNPNMLQFDTKDVDIRTQILATKDVDIRQIPPVFDEDEPKLKIAGDESIESSLPVDLPKTQRDLYLRIQSQQKTNTPEQQQHCDNLEIDDNINWYSDDDDEDENRLTIKVDNDEEKKDDTESTIMSPTQIKPQEVVEKLGDLSKIDISAEVTKLLTSMTQQKDATQQGGGGGSGGSASTGVESTTKPLIRDPRQNRSTSTSQVTTQSRTEQKLSIYEQGSIMTDGSSEQARSPDDVVESDFRSRPDVDLRNLHLPFKGMLNYTPAKEIDASVNSHPPMVWKVEIVDIPRPDYTGLKLNIQDAEKTGDPRLRKIFRLSTEEKDSPASPKASPKATTRVDPRLKKIEENKQQQDTGNLSYTQQLNLLQSSVFFQSLTSNQKLLLNQELASRSDQNGLNDPVLTSMLTTLNLIPNNNIGNNTNMGTALNILANVNKLNPPMNPAGPPMVLRQNPNLINQMAQNMVQPGLLGAAPGIPNLPTDFPINYDPRSGGGMINNPNNFGNFPPAAGGNFDDYYPPQDNNFNNRDNRNFNRDRRRGRNNFNRNNGNRNFRNRNRNNRSHTPP